MNDQDKIAEQAAEIARLNAALANRKAKIAELMGEAARAEIAGASASVPVDRNAVIDECADALEQLHGRCGRNDVGVRNGVFDARQVVVSLKSAAPVSAQPAVQPCPACGGSGETMVMSDAGPDAYEIPANCPHCNGTGGLDDAYRGVCALLAAEQRKYLEACAKSYFRPDIAPLPEQTGPSAEMPEEWRVKLKSIADWMDSSAQQQQISPEEFSYVSSFDYELAQAASELFTLAASPSPAPAQQQEPTLKDSLAEALHYPGCWDTAAYPALSDALSAVYGHFKCSECAAPGASIGEA